MNDRFEGVTDDNWRTFVADMAELLELREGERIFEVACGAGAFLSPLRDAGCVIGGLDASASSIDTARRLMPGGDWTVGEADSLDASGGWDVVVACGAFAAFPNLAYASDVLTRMLAKTDRAIAVLDVPDVDEKEAGPEVPGRLYFTRGWFLETLGALGANAIEVVEQRINGYPTGRHRFNVVARLK